MQQQCINVNKSTDYGHTYSLFSCPSNAVQFFFIAAKSQSNALNFAQGEKSRKTNQQNKRKSERDGEEKNAFHFMLFIIKMSFWHFLYL